MVNNLLSVRVRDPGEEIANDGICLRIYLLLRPWYWLGSIRPQRIGSAIGRLSQGLLGLLDNVLADVVTDPVEVNTELRLVRIP